MLLMMVLEVMQRRTNERTICQHALSGARHVVGDCNHETSDGEMFQLRPRRHRQRLHHYLHLCSVVAAATVRRFLGSSTSFNLYMFCFSFYRILIDLQSQTA